jgi:hypothetical protein
MAQHRTLKTLSFPYFRPLKPTQNHHGKTTGLAGDAVVTIALEWTRKKWPFRLPRQWPQHRARRG